MNTPPKCMEGVCNRPADAECEGCGDEMCYSHLREGYCDVCLDAYLGLDPEPLPLPRPTTYRSVA